MKLGLRWLAVGMVSLGAGLASHATPVRPPPFVTVQGGQFTVGGNPFYFSGTDAYYLLQYESYNNGSLETTLDTFVANNVTVVRTWGFLDGPDFVQSASDPILQNPAGVYNEANLVKLDSAFNKLKARNLRAIVPLCNNWGHLGGIPQYLKWFGQNPGAHPNHAEGLYFYTNPQTKTAYKNYVSMLLNRVNTITGVAYKDDPTILAWELMNEARIATETDVTILKGWYVEMAQFVKGIDPNHLVGTGEDGFEETMDNPATSLYDTNLSNLYVLRAHEGTSFWENIRIPQIDYAGLHIYPGGFAFSTANDYALWTSESLTYVKDRAKLAASVGKPLVIGEHGWGNHQGTVPDTPYKITFYGAMWDLFKTDPRIGGGLFWQFIAGTVSPDKSGEFSGNIGSVRDPQLTAMFSKYGADMKAKGGSGPPPPPPPGDADGDGLPDAWEVTYFGNTTAQNGAGDPDADGLSNASEYGAGTDPTKADTDGDGMLDGSEVTFGFDPLKADQNGNGIPDGQEDWDGDGVPNASDPTPGSPPPPAGGGGSGGGGCGLMGLEGIVLWILGHKARRNRQGLGTGSG